MNKPFDFIIVGGGILGASVAFELQNRKPGCKLLLIEREPQPALHQTGRNSGVVHSGIYYKPESLKAKPCQKGNSATKEFCQQYDIPFKECGKLIIATTSEELEILNSLVIRAKQHKLTIETLNQEQLKKREPLCQGLKAIFIPSTAIVNYRNITKKMLAMIAEHGGKISYSTKVTGLNENLSYVEVSTDRGNFYADKLIGCVGIMSDSLVEMLGLKPNFKMIPFKGEYFLLPPKYNNSFNHLIYPVPKPELPFLGVHITQMINGSVTVGPNAVLALKKYGYAKTDISFKELFDILNYSGFRKMFLKNFNTGLLEIKNSLFKKSYLKLVRKYCPQIELKDLTKHPAGIRAQAITATGDLVEDFLFITSQHSFIVANAPSPGATSAIPIAQHIVSQVL